MKQILSNIALLQCLNECKKHGIDPSGTHLEKYPRRYVYALCKNTTGKALVTITYYKSQTPLITINNARTY